MHLKRLGLWKVIKVHSPVKEALGGLLVPLPFCVGEHMEGTTNWQGTLTRHQIC